MQRANEHNYLLKYIESLQSQGQYAFSLDQVRKEFKQLSEWAIQIGLNRLVNKNKVVSVHRGFYVIVPPEFAVRGILPASSFIDSLMSHLKKPYYVGLLSAAEIHGAAHQRPQEFFVVTNLPSIRHKLIKGLKINFVSKIKISKEGIERKKTDTGYMKVSSPELTAIDILLFENRVGGLNRVVTLLDELLENVNPEKLKTLLKKNIPLAIIQRLGYISGRILNREEIAAVLLNYLKNKELMRVPLRAIGKRSGFATDPDWKIVINAKPESDL